MNLRLPLLRLSQNCPAIDSGVSTVISRNIGERNSANIANPATIGSIVVIIEKRRGSGRVGTLPTGLNSRCWTMTGLYGVRRNGT